MRKKIYQYKRLWLLVLFMAYVLIGYFYAPKIIRQQLSQQLSVQMNMQAEMTAVKFNPLTFNTEIEGLTITDANQKTWYESQLTGINFDPLNLLWGEWKFSDLNLVQPKITVLTDTDGQVIIPALPEFPESIDAAEPINFSIDQIRLVQGRMKLQAGNVKKDFSLNIKSIELKQDKFSLADEETKFEIKVITENDESIALKGRYNYLQQTINSDIQLIDWQATTLNKILPDELAINNQAGQIQATGHIDWLLNKKLLINFSNIEIQAFQSHWQGDVSFQQLNASIQQVVIDAEAQTVGIEHIESNQGDWQVLWPFESAVDAVTDSAAAVETAEAPAWQVNINQINLQNTPIEFIDSEVNASLLFTVQSLEVLELNNLNQPFTLQGQFKFADGGTLNINSEQVLSPLAVSADVNVKQLSLQQIAPWITDLSDLVFTEGKLTAEQQLNLNDRDFDLTGSLTITNANINDQNAQSMASWGELNIAATTLSSQSQSIVLDQITVNQAQGAISIESENNINVQSLDTNQASGKNMQNSDSSDWSIKIGAINSKDTDNETANPDG